MRACQSNLFDGAYLPGTLKRCALGHDAVIRGTWLDACTPFAIVFALEHLWRIQFLLVPDARVW